MLTTGDVRQAIESPQDERFDVGLAGNQPFLNTASIGWYVDLVARRERYEQRLPRRVAKLLAAVVQVGRVRRLRVMLDGAPYKVWMVWVGNGEFSMAPLSLAAREASDDGLLDVRLLGAGGRIPKLRAALALVRGNAESSGLVDRRLLKRCELTMGSAKSIRIALDGELIRVANPIEFSCRSKALAVRVAPHRVETQVPRSSVGPP